MAYLWNYLTNFNDVRLYYRVFKHACMSLGDSRSRSRKKVKVKVILYSLSAELCVCVFMWLSNIAHKLRFEPLLFYTMSDLYYGEACHVPDGIKSSWSPNAQNVKTTYRKYRNPTCLKRWQHHVDMSCVTVTVTLKNLVADPDMW